MLEKLNENDELTFKDITPEEREKRGILGRLYGPCASTIRSTRNGRHYSDELWEKVFENPINKELLKQGGIPGELDHPADRLETDSSKIAIMMPEAPRKDKNGRLVGYWDIIDTPCGKIAYSLAKYGFKLGISSRGNGETYSTGNGNEEVDPDSYEFTAFDLVLVPACEDARLNLITEGVDQTKIAFKKALNESLEAAKPEDRKLMEETLRDLNIDYSDSLNESNNTSNDTAAKDSGAELLKTLQESLLAKEQAEAKITELQEKLSVCYAKEASMEEDLNKYKIAVRNLTESTKSMKILEGKVKSLTEELESKNSEILKESNNCKDLANKKSLVETKNNSLLEKLSDKTQKLEKANLTIKSLTEELDSYKKTSDEEKASLVEKYETIKKDLKVKQTEYNNKLSNTNALVEKYKSTAQKAVNKYIESKATILGISLNEVLNKLPKNYSFNDIDSICEDLSNYHLQMNSLPFNVSSVKNVSITEGKKLNELFKSPLSDGDDIDDSLLRLVNNMTHQN